MGVKRKRMPGCRCCALVPCFAWVTVTDGTGAPAAGATVTASDAGGVVATATADASGNAALALPADGVYTIATALGANSGSQSLYLCCGNGPCAVSIVVVGCYNLPLAGAAVTVTQGALTVAGTTDAGGHFAASVQSGIPCTVAASYPPRLAAASGTVTCSSGPASLAVALQPAAGYHCLPPGQWGPECVYPIKDTISGSDSVLGGAALSYNPAVGYWTGTSSYPANPSLGCSAGTLAINWYFGGGTSGLPAVYGDGVSGGGLYASCGGSGGIILGFGHAVTGQSCPPALSLAYQVLCTGNSNDVAGLEVYGLPGTTPAGTVVATRTFTE